LPACRWYLGMPLGTWDECHALHLEQGQSREGIVMITDGFGPRMVANMEIALERACEFLPLGNEQHEGRRHVASKILECAKTGNGSVQALTAAGRTAAIELHAPAASPRDDGGPLR
jgi:hypothetical protein